MRNGFTLHDPGSAPEASRGQLAQAEKALGKIPNLERVMAEAPALLEGYVATWDLFDRTALSRIERQVVYQTANVHNGCDYCRPWHAKLSEMAGMAPDQMQALRDGHPLDDPRLEALRRFTQAVLETRGAVPEAGVTAFMEAGFSHRHALEVVLGLAVKLMSNYTNALAGTPLDPEVKAWAP